VARLLAIPAIGLIVACRGGAGGTSNPVRTPELEATTVTPDGVRLWYRVVGDGPQTVVIPNALFHGTRLDGLADERRRLVLYDPRGRGRSDSVGAGQISLDHNLADVETIRQAVGADSIALIGWSGMGMELFVYALRHPGRVTRLVQLAPVAPRWTPYSDSLGSSRQARTDPQAREQLQARITAGDFSTDQGGLCRALAAVTTPPSFGDTSKARLAPDVCQWPNEWPDRIGAYFATFLKSIEGFDWRSDLARVTIPRLVIHGARDNTPLAGNQEWVTGQPNARILVVSDAGHWPQYERPELAIPAIRTFLDGAWPPNTAPYSDRSATIGSPLVGAPGQKQ
jgi:proline iminopeptidase